MEAAAPHLPRHPVIIRRPGKKPVWRSVLVGVVSGGLGAALALGAVRLLGPELTGMARGRELRAALGPWMGPAFGLAALAAMWLAVLAHEVGHLAGGALVRFRFLMLVVGPLRVERGDNDRVRVGLNRDLALYGGLAGTLPTGTHALPRRLGVMVAGGPAASFLLSGAAAALVAGAGGGLPALLQSLLGMMMIISAGLGVVTLVPMRFSGFSSDGARLLRLARGADARREAGMLSLLALGVGDTPPRDWPEETVRAVTEARDGTSDEVTAWLLAYSHRLDRGDVPAARQALHRALELADQYPPPFVPALMAEAAFFEGFFARDAEAARAYLAEVPAKAPAVRGYDRLRAQAALALAEGDRAAAAERVAQAREATPAKDAFRLALLDQMAAAASTRESVSA